MENKINHIAIIMDGNRRWAKEKGLSASEGHRAGAETLVKLVRHVAKLNIKYLTVYALSTENLSNRSKLEVGSLFKLLQEKIVEHLGELNKEGIKLKILGDLSALPNIVQKSVNKASSLLNNNTQAQLNIALNYGSRAEIVRAAKKIVETKLPLSEIDEQELSEKLYTEGIPDPEIVIRTGGEKRISNFLLWQIAYSELFFTETLWPDFSPQELDTIIKEYSRRKRNFGKWTKYLVFGR